MITFTNTSFEFGGRFLYKDVSLSINLREKIGLIGKNGTGKTTLLRLITGEFQPSSGSVTRLGSLSIGYLNQDLLSIQSQDSIYQVAMQAFDRELTIQADIEKVLQQLETNYSDALVSKLGHLQSEFEALGGYELDSRVGTVLAGLGFKNADLERPLSSFSGGWRMRVMLAKMLLRQPDLLLLDEPTNHLDLPSIQWLEGYLEYYPGTYIIVSHDREFLDRVITRTLEIAQLGIHSFSGNYAFYLKERELRNQIRQAEYENQQKYFADQERFIQRFRAKASKATQVQSRIKNLEKIDIIEPVIDDNASIKLQFQVKTQPGREILSLDQVSKSYGEVKVLNNTSATIWRGDKIGLIGANGIGKSTILRMLDGREPFQGERKLGYHVVMSLFAQHQLENLVPENTLLEELSQYVHEKGETYIRTILGCFLFTGDDVDKKVKVLSGGEKSRLALAKTLLSDANCLLLDEPTNHLDLQSIQILIQALQQYSGSYVVISHDRHFLRQTTEKIWFIEEGQIQEYPGSYSEFDTWYQTKKNKQNVTVSKLSKSVTQKTKMARNLEDIRQDIEKIEILIEEMELRLEELEFKMNSEEYADYPDRITQFEKEYKRTELKLEQTTKEWEKLIEELEQTQSK